METPRDWHEDDRFWELAEPIMFDENRKLLAQTEVDQVVRMLQPGAGAAFLDLCCGPGRHAVELARRGYNVTGVDRTQRYLDRAREKAQGLSLELVRQDAREFCRKEAFDFALNLYTSFGYFESPEDDLRMARNIADSLRPGGKLLLQTMGKEVIGKQFVELDWTERDGMVLLDERALHPSFAAIENRWTILGPDGSREQIGFVVRLYAATEMEALLKQAGFRHVRFFGGLDGTPYDHTARRMVALAQK